jgi:hypothetical protein
LSNLLISSKQLAELLMLPWGHLILFANVSRECRTGADFVKMKEVSRRSWDTVTAGGRTISIPPCGIVRGLLDFANRLPNVVPTSDQSIITYADVVADRTANSLLGPSGNHMTNDYWRILQRDFRHHNVMDDASILLDRSLMGEIDAGVVVARLHAAAARTAVVASYGSLRRLLPSRTKTKEIGI